MASCTAGDVRRSGRCSRLHQLIVTPLHLRRRDVFDAVSEHPLVTERVAHGARALAVECVRGGAHQRRAGAEGALDRGVRVVDVEVERDRRAADRLWPENESVERNLRKT